MDSQRLILFFVFSFSLFLLLDAWQRDRQTESAPLSTSAPVAGGKAEKAPPQAAQVPIPSEKLIAAQSGVPQQAQPRSEPGGLVHVETDVLRAQISASGGDLTRLELKNHRDTLDRNKPFVLLDRNAEHTYVAQSGLIGRELPNHRTQFSIAARRYQLAEGDKTVDVRLSAPPNDGVQVTKVYRFHRNSYLIDVSFEIANQGTAAIQPYAYFQMVRDDKPLAGFSTMVPTFTGIAVYTDKDKFQKVSFEDIQEGKTSYPKNSLDGWIGMLQHYFVGALLPRNDAPREFYTRRLDDGLFAAGTIVPAGNVAPGASGTVTVPLYAGPQEQDKLAKIAPGLDLTVDYGWLTVIAVPLFWVLNWLHKWAQNWGVAIILLTIIIKLIFYPLSATSYRSMAKMRVVAPKLQKLKEQYGSDRQRLQQAMMELYKTEKINPLGGCMPIVVQIPVFISLYWVLLGSVELRHAPFMLWIDDLSAPDPYYILPILMGATMIIQTWLNPTPPDPVQAKIMKIMPIAFSIFFFFFPAGLVLYWLVNNVLSITQQWHITRMIEREARAGARKSRR
ncbi:MAG: membrane protein insertase YidC [Betaproteobacteria bacterium]|nr:membrane protein insertase YidC [Betaproteobacteria bacterium]MDH3437498.1 membrane protein insertase YidC [Betaproteobacteria bacterium]